MSDVRSAAPRPAVSAAIVAVMLAVPAAYVLLAHSAAGDAQAQTAHLPQNAVQQSGTTNGESNLAMLEHLATSDPTAANRLNFSQALIDQGMRGRAIQVLKALLADDPKNALAWNNLCVAHTLQQDYNLAVTACETGILLDPSAPLIKNNLKWAQDERSKALSVLSAQEGTPEAQRNAAFYLAEGMNYLHLGDNAQAIAAWRRCLLLDPRNFAAQNNIGLALMLEAHYRDAETSFRQALVIDPESQLAKNNLAWAMDEEKTVR